MKNITIKRMTLLNFKGIRSLTIDFNERVTLVMGRNGSGKTTVFDAFTWLLFGKNSEGRKEFGIKTRDAAGEVIPRLPHEVSAVLSVNGEEITLCRRLTEKWTKKRGSQTEEFTGNAEERLYNDVPCSVAEWNGKIDGICPEQVFRFITDPYHFTRQKPDVQRTMLFRMAGAVSDSEIADGNDEFRALLDKITGKTLEEYRREIAAKKKRVKAEIDTIPGRIDERKRDMPEEQDWDSVTASIDEKKRRKSEIETQISDASKAYEAANNERMEQMKKIATLKRERLALENDIRYTVQADFLKSRKAKETAEDNLHTLTHSIALEGEGIKDDMKKLEECKAQRERLITEWRGINARTLTFKEEDFTCPTCGRTFEPGEIEARRHEMTRRFNAAKAEELARNVEKGQRIRKQMQQLEENIADRKRNNEARAAEIAAIQASEAYNADPECPDATPAIVANADYQSLSRQIEELETKINEPVETIDNAFLKERCKRIDDEIYALNAILVTKNLIERNNGRIAALESMLRSLSQELAGLEGDELTIAAFTKAKVEEMDKRVNGMFSTVRFKMYERQINGGETETCEATVDGVPYSDLNSAGRLAAGLDIINAICRSEGVTAPIMIDNSESINEIPDTLSQQVRLTVTLDDELVIINN